MNRNNRSKISAALMTAAMMAMINDDRKTYHEIVSQPKTLPPWHNVKLTKAERKGKTFEEIQAMRQAKWEADTKDL